MRKRVFVFAIIILFVILAVIFLLSARNAPKTEAPIPTTPKLQPRETATPTPTTVGQESSPQKNKQTLIASLPYIGVGFTIEYLPSQDLFFIEINKMPYETYKADAEDWFARQGADVQNLNVRWGSTRGVYPAQ